MDTTWKSLRGRVTASHSRRTVASLTAVALASAALTACGFGGGSASDGKTVTIGVTAPLTGPAADQGAALKAGMKFAVDQWNDKGGVDVGGKKMKVRADFEDNEGSPAKGLTAGTKLITQDKVNVLIGDAFNSDVTLAEMNLASQYDIPVMSGESTADAITAAIVKNPAKYKNFWKATWGSDAYGKAIAAFYEGMVKAGKIDASNKKVAFISEDTSFGRTIATITAKDMQADGWSASANEVVPVGATDFGSALTKIKSKKPAAVVSIFTAVNSGVAFQKQFQQQGLTAAQTAVYYPLETQFAQALGSTVDGLTWVPDNWQPAHFPTQGKWAAAFKKVTGKDATTSEYGFGADYMNILLEAVKRAGSLDTDAITKAMGETDYAGNQGTYKFDPKTHTAMSGPGLLEFPIAQFEDGSSAAITTDTYKTPSWQK